MFLLHSWLTEFWAKSQAESVWRWLSLVHYISFGPVVSGGGKHDSPFGICSLKVMHKFHSYRHGHRCHCMRPHTAPWSSERTLTGWQHDFQTYSIAQSSECTQLWTLAYFYTTHSHIHTALYSVHHKRIKAANHFCAFLTFQTSQIRRMCTRGSSFVLLQIDFSPYY